MIPHIEKNQRDKFFNPYHNGCASTRHPTRIMDAISLQNKTLAIVMGGGAGTRLFPLTKDRAKPAVPLAGKYRLVDIPISNCLNSGFRRVYVLTQFNSMSLHRHINASYKFDNFSRNFVEVLAAQQTTEGARWYQGTADAVRQNLRYFLEDPYEYYLILSGDQLYRMDYSALMQQHVENGADITLATTPVDRTAASAFGIMHSDADRRIFRFEEKPKDPKLLDELKIPPELLKTLDLPADSDLFQGSMGIYVFNRDVLIKCLAGDQDDFGKHIIPVSLNQYKVMVYIFKGYWEDIGTIRAFFEANLALTDTLPPYNFFDRLAPIYTHPRFLPASKINAATIRRAIIADGCIISDAHIDRAIIGVRSNIESGATIRNSVIMGADFYEELAERTNPNVPPIGIGRNSVVDRAIIDKNARIGENVVITPDGKAPNVDSENYYIRDGVVVIPKNAVLADGTWI
jgi:glucose-1-phosphate adenylyltransferase